MLEKLPEEKPNDVESPQEIPWWRTSFSKEAEIAVAKSVREEHLSQGPVVKEFEGRLAEYLGVPYVVATTSGSISLLMSLLAIGVRHDDEVIIPNRTWIATAHAPLLLGAKIKLVDVENDRPIINVAKIEKAITPKTKAIIPVHMNGRSANMSEIRKIANNHNLKVIEDAAQALGSCNQDGFLGTQSDMGCFSLSMAKIVSTGQGGFVVTHDKSMYEKLIALRAHGVGNVSDTEWEEPGFNFRFTDVLASIGIVQLKELEGHVKKVKAIYSRYMDGLADLPFLKLVPVDIESGEIPIYIEVLCWDRKSLIRFLRERGIQSRAFYPDLNLASYFNSQGSFPNSEIYGKQGLYLPSGPGQSLENIDRVLSSLRDYKEYQ
jgi:perosamine synthetase